MKKNKKKHYNLDYDNLAIPEIHTHKQKNKETPEPKPSITYDTVAIPEIHIKKD